MGALFSQETRGGKLRLKATGAWTLANAGTLEGELQSFCDSANGAKVLTIDMAGVSAFDSFGAWLLERLRRECAAKGARVRIEGMPSVNQPIYDELSGVNLQPSPAAPSRLMRWRKGVGESADALASDMFGFFVTTGAVFAALGRLSMRPRGFRLTSSVSQFDRTSWQAVPIIVMITFLIGAILAQQGFFHFRKFGADLYVVDMVGFLIMRELGVLLVAIMVAGRTGSAFTAELGSMKMREEVDALRTMGLDPVDILILPRIIVLVIAMPVLTFIGSMAALYGAGLVSTIYGGMSTPLFIDRLREAITMDHFLVGMIKAPFIGFVIGIIACNEGLSVKGSAESLGRHTTRSVVKAIFMVIVLDAMFALFFSAIGM
jgi:phospholipid/cholesterol/gamma-HCH transport system permease protein